MRRWSFYLAVFGLPLFFAGCSGSPGPSDAPIRVTISNVFANNSIQAGEPAVTLEAVVDNDPGKKGVKWSLSTANTGCSPGCGTLVAGDSPSFSAVYTPPASAPANQQATITAASVADPNQTFSFLFTIEALTSVAITDKFDSVVAGSPALEVDANVKDDPTGSGVTWTLMAGGSDCSPGCGTLAASAAPSFAALYTPPATVPAGAAASPTITATAVHRAAAVDSFTFNITNAASLVKGNFAFLLRGYDSFSGAPMAMAGTVVADGNGNLTGGEVDINNGGGVTLVTPPVAGVYTVDNAFHGITKGSFEITSFHFPNSTIDLKFQFVLSADGTHGRIIELDGSGYLNSGTIVLQDPAALSASPDGNFAFGLDSDAPFAGRTVSTGQLVFGAAGITGGIIDQAKAADPAPTFSGAALNASSVAAPDASGRGTLTIDVGGDATNYAYYVVNADLVHLIQIDKGLNHGTVQAGVARRQKALTSDSVNSTSVIQLTGMDEPTGTSNVGPAVTVGVMTISGGTSFTLTFDTNDLGTNLTSHFTNGSIASFDPATGRAVLSAPGDFQAGFVDSAVMYFYDQGSAFFIDTDISTPDGTPPDQAMTNNAFSGTLTPQVGTSFSASDLSGNILAGFGGSSAPGIPNFELAMNFDGSAGTYEAAGDLTSLPSQDGAATGVQFNGTFGILNSLLGHGTMTLPSAVFGDFTSGGTSQAAFYMIAPRQFVLIGVTPGQYSGVAFFDPQ